jgi:hypothetical protein
MSVVGRSEKEEEVKAILRVEILPPHKFRGHVNSQHISHSLALMIEWCELIENSNDLEKLFWIDFILSAQMRKEEEEEEEKFKSNNIKIHNFWAEQKNIFFGFQFFHRFSEIRRTVREKNLHYFWGVFASFLNLFDFFSHSLSLC